MKVIIHVPALAFPGITIPLESIMDEDQIKDTIDKGLRKRSILAEKIEIKK